MTDKLKQCVVLNFFKKLAQECQRLELSESLGLTNKIVES